MKPVNDESAPKWGAPETSWRRSEHSVTPEHRDRPAASPNPSQVARSDQARAAAADAARILHRVAALSGHPCTVGRPSQWVLELVDHVVSGRRTCKHLRRAAPGVAFLAAHRRRLECQRCSWRSNVAVAGTREDRCCDRCRVEMAAGQVLTVTAAVGSIIVTAGHCEQCAPVVRGTAVVAS